MTTRQIEIFFPNQNRHVRFLLGLYISRKRNELGFSVQDMASRVEMTPQIYKRIEGGRMKITSDCFEKIQSLLFLESHELDEIRKISGVRYINDLSKTLISNYPA